MAPTLGEEVVRAHGGEPIGIKVAETGTIGYLWRVKTDDSEVQVIGHRIEANTELSGGIGEAAFVLEGLAPGDPAVRLNSQAPAASHE